MIACVPESMAKVALTQTLGTSSPIHPISATFLLLALVAVFRLTRLRDDVSARAAG